MLRLPRCSVQALPKNVPRHRWTAALEFGAGVVGFGRFGQFISEKMVKYGFNVYATSRSDYTSEANKMNVFNINEHNYFLFEDPLRNNVRDIYYYDEKISSS